MTLSPFLIASRIIPHSIEAEQALIGAILMDVRVIEEVGELKGENFYEPFHGHIFAAAIEMNRRGELISPLTMRNVIGGHEAYSIIGGDSYIAKIAAMAVSAVNAGDYARMIFDLHVRRQVILICEATLESANSNDIAIRAEEIIGSAIDALDAQGKSLGADGVRSASEYMAGVLERHAGRKSIPVSTGFKCLDNLYRLRPGDLSVVTGIPSSGKSEFIDAVLINMAKNNGMKFAMCSFENDPEEHVEKLIEKYMGRQLQGSSRYPKMSVAEVLSGGDWVDQHFHFIRTDKDSPTIDWVLARASETVKKHKVNGLVIDPYNELDHNLPTGKREDQYISEMLSKLKRFAKRNQVHVWLVAHPQKPPPDKRTEVPGLYDISGGANFVNKADAGVVVHRKFNDDGTRSSIVEIHVKKVRFRAIGKPGMALMDYNYHTCSYEDSEHEEESVT